jgi:hypothetical protein
MGQLILGTAWQQKKIWSKKNFSTKINGEEKKIVLIIISARGQFLQHEFEPKGEVWPPVEKLSPAGEHSPLRSPQV